MSYQQKQYYVDSYQLTSIIQIQRGIPKRYNPRDYLGECMRIQEEQSASFLNEFVNDIAVVLPEHYDLIESLLFVLCSSNYKPIKKLLPHATKKFHLMKHILREHQTAAKLVRQELTSNSRFNILDNKKKMVLMSCTDLCALGDAINAEHRFNTTKIKDKFNAFVTYRIESVLLGKMPIDVDFNVLLTKFGTSSQNDLYKKIITNQIKSYMPVQLQPLGNIQQKPQSKPQSKTRRVAHSAPQPKQPKEKKSGFGFFKKIREGAKKSVGFFKKIGEGAKKVFNKVKKPLLIGGLFALSIFGGKRLYDAAVEHNTNTVKTETVINKQSDVQKKQTINTNDSLRVNKKQPVINNNNNKQALTTPVSNDVLKKIVGQLQYLKATNPTDRNMDVTQTATRLCQKFGNDAYNVVLVSAMTPYALNDYTKFDFRPSTHNLIKYFSTHDLTSAQRNALDKFIATHVNNNTINMNNFAAYNVNSLMQYQR